MLDENGKYGLAVGLAQDESDGIADERKTNGLGGHPDEEGSIRRRKLREQTRPARMPGSGPILTMDRRLSVVLSRVLAGC
jgi:hypothetical protein